MTRLIHLVQQVRHWFARHFGAVAPISTDLNDFRIEESDVTDDLAYGRD